MNRVLGYRKMIGLTQSKMAKELGIAEATYRMKEKGRSYFTDKEITSFIEVLKRADPNVNVSDIFFTTKPTKKEEKEGGNVKSAIR